MPKYRLWIDVDLPGCKDILDLHDKDGFQEALRHPNWWSACGAKLLDPACDSEPVTAGIPKDTQ